jgi:heme oxygenase
MIPPWMLVRLGIETSIYHANADDDRLEALSIRTIDEYRAFLVRVFGFEAPVEEALGGVRELELRFLRERARVPLLRHDILELGWSEHQLAQCPRVSPITIHGAAEALGWMFVLERQTLLAGLIRRQMQGVLGPTIPAGYLGAYGDKPGARFRAFGSGLGDLAHSLKPAAIIEGASAAFRAQHHWYQQREQLDSAPVLVRDTSDRAIA